MAHLLPYTGAEVSLICQRSHGSHILLVDHGAHFRLGLRKPFGDHCCSQALTDSAGDGAGTGEEDKTSSQQRRDTSSLDVKEWLCASPT